jgi:hypothetical protein
LMREPSLTRTSKSSFFCLPGETDGEGTSGPSLMKTTLAKALKTVDGIQKTSTLEESPSKALASGPFPGIEDATQISEDEEDESDADEVEGKAIPSTTAGGLVEAGISMGGYGSQNLGPSGLSSAGDLGGLPGTADASTFLPSMARKVEDLLHIKGGLEDALKQLIRSSRAKDESGDSQPGMPQQRVRSVALLTAPAHTDVDPSIAGEILRGTSAALRFAEGMLAKGKGEPLLLSANGGQDAEGSDGAGVNSSLRANEGLDERDVFLSLMRSLPSEQPSLSRQGFASSAPHLSPMRPPSLTAENRHSSHASIPVPSLRLSSSTGSAASRLMRNRSTKHLGSIAEQPLSPSPEESAPSSPTQPEAAPANDTANLEFSGEIMKEAANRVKQLCHHLELVNDAYCDMREQFKPLQEEYFRRLDECRFLEAQCRRLDVHCRLLEERAPAGDAGSASRSQMLTLTGGGNMLPRFQRIQGNGGMGRSLTLGVGDSPGSGSSGASWGTLTPSGSQEVLRNQAAAIHASSASGSPVPTILGLGHATSASSGGRPWTWGVGAGNPPGGTAARHTNSATSLGLNASPTPATGKPEVPPRGLLYAASVNELCLDSQRPQGSTRVLGNTGASWQTEEYIRRVASTPQLHSATQILQDRKVLPQDTQAAAASARSSGFAAGSNVAMGAGVVPPIRVQLVGASAEDESSSTATIAGMDSHSFDSSTFLSLAKQPGAKTAALQYLIASSRNALGTIGESQEPCGRSSSKTPGTSPARSASVGSLGGVGAISGQGGVSAGQASQSMPSSVMPSTPHEGYSSAAVSGHRHALSTSGYGSVGRGPMSRAPYRPVSSNGAGSGVQGSDFARDRLQPRAQQPAVRPANILAGGLPSGGLTGASLAPRRQNSVGQLNSGLGSSQLGGTSHRLG